MRTRAAVLHEINADWSVEEIELDPPKRGEVLIKMVAAGLCHSDEHARDGESAGGVAEPPFVGGHEGAGIVEEVGEGVYDLAPGDHVVFGFVPACGKCPSCATGHSNLCDDAMYFPVGRQISDGTARHHTLDGNDLGLMCLLGTFAEHTVVNQNSCVKVDPGWPLDKAVLLGCGVVTGWGSAVYSAKVQAGEYAAVVGCGGIGMNAVQGAAMAGARVVAAIDPVESKRDLAKQMGATHTYASVGEALMDMGNSTWGRGFDAVVMAIGSGRSEVMGEAFHLGGKRSRIVITNLHPTSEESLAIPGFLMAVFEKQIIGSLFGSGNFRRDIPYLFELYLDGQLKLDELITQTYSLEEINAGYEALRRGDNVRGVILFD